jgi:hypothetical protein
LVKDNAKQKKHYFAQVVERRKEKRWKKEKKERKQKEKSSAYHRE